MGIFQQTEDDSTIIMIGKLLGRQSCVIFVVLSHTNDMYTLEQIFSHVEKIPKAEPVLPCTTGWNI